MAKKRSVAGKRKSDVVLDFGSAFSYPFNRAKGMLNVLWLLLPIFGWFALSGYGVRIVQGFIRGKFKELPLFSFGSDMKLGFFMFLKSIPFVFAYMIFYYVLEFIPVLGDIAGLVISFFVVPILGINFIRKESVASFFEFEIVSVVFENLGEYVVALLKSIALFIVFLFMIIVLVGIPGGIFTNNIFLADFYRRRVA